MKKYLYIVFGVVIGISATSLIHGWGTIKCRYRMDGLSGLFTAKEVDLSKGEMAIGFWERDDKILIVHPKNNPDMRVQIYIAESPEGKMDKISAVKINSGRTVHYDFFDLNLDGVVDEWVFSRWNKTDEFSDGSGTTVTKYSYKTDDGHPVLISPEGSSNDLIRINNDYIPYFYNDGENYTDLEGVVHSIDMRHFLTYEDWLFIFAKYHEQANQLIDPTWTTPFLKAESDSQAGHE